MSKHKRNKEYLDKIKRSDEQIARGEIYEVDIEELTDKYEGAYFEFKIPPEESKFLKSWKKLQEDKEFQNKLTKIREEIAKEEVNERNKKRRSVHGRLRRPAKRNPRRK